MKRLYKNLVLMSLALLVVVLSSCSGSDYLNAIPKKKYSSYLGGFAADGFR